MPSSCPPDCLSPRDRVRLRGRQGNAADKGVKGEFISSRSLKIGIAVVRRSSDKDAIISGFNVRIERPNLTEKTEKTRFADISRCDNS